MDGLKRCFVREFYNIVSNLKIGQTTKAINSKYCNCIKTFRQAYKINTDNLEKLRNNIINQKNELFKLYSNSYLSKLKIQDIFK